MLQDFGSWDSIFIVGDAMAFLVVRTVNAALDKSFLVASLNLNLNQAAARYSVCKSGHWCFVPHSSNQKDIHTLRALHHT